MVKTPDKEDYLGVMVITDPYRRATRLDVRGFDDSSRALYLILSCFLKPIPKSGVHGPLGSVMMMTAAGIASVLRRAAKHWDVLAES